MRKWWKRVDFLYVWLIFFISCFSVFFSATKQILCNNNFLFYLILEEIFDVVFSVDECVAFLIDACVAFSDDRQ